MELRNFIKEAIEQIADGVLNASNACEPKGVKVNPLMRDGEGLSFTQYNDTASVIKFKIGLCKSDDASVQNGIGVFLAGFGIGTSNKGNEHSDTITSIEFSLPIEFPHNNM